MGNMSNILHNATVDALLERRSIRKFKPKPLSDDIVETLEPWPSMPQAVNS